MNFTIGVKEWMSLLVSTGYPKRNIIACDTSTQITDVKALRIAANDFSIIGRYLTGATTAAPKNLTRAELQILFNRRISVFAIYQDEKAYYVTNPNEYSTVNYYDYEQGLNDAEKACDAAIALGIPYGEYIFFSVDYDFNDAQVTSMIIPHFKGINEYMRKQGSKYKIGIYGPRNICTRVSNVAYAELSFVSDMSTGFSGNLGYKLPENWAFDQIREYFQGAADGSFNLDCVAVSGSYLGFNSIIPENIIQNNVDSKVISLSICKRILSRLGVTPDINFAFETDFFEFNCVGFSVKYKATIGNTINNDPNSLTELTVTNGEFSGAEFTAALDVMDGISIETGTELAADGNCEITTDLKWEINNGYMLIGVLLNPLSSTMATQIIIHKDADVSEGVTDYFEIEIDITTNSALTADELKAYNDYQDAIDTANAYHGNTDSDIIGTIIIVLLIIAVVAILVLTPWPVLLGAAVIV